MKNRFLAVTAALFASVLFVPVASATKDSKEAALVREAKITMAQARKTALERVPGNIELAQLERGRGGKLLFEFEIHTPEKRESEVHVDAITNEVFRVSEESGKVSASKNARLIGAKVSFDEAETAALNRVPGAVVFAVVEEERDKTLYKFEIIASDNKEASVYVDATSGAIEQVEQD